MTKTTAVGCLPDPSRPNFRTAEAPPPSTRILSKNATASAAVLEGSKLVAAESVRAPLAFTAPAADESTTAATPCSVVGGALDCVVVAVAVGAVEGAALRRAADDVAVGVVEVEGAALRRAADDVAVGVVEVEGAALRRAADDVAVGVVEVEGAALRRAADDVGVGVVEVEVAERAARGAGAAAWGRALNGVRQGDGPGALLNCILVGGDKEWMGVNA